jgi:hypothetical protein
LRLYIDEIKDKKPIIEIVTLTYLDLNYLVVGRKSLCMQTTSIVYCGCVDP